MHLTSRQLATAAKGSFGTILEGFADLSVSEDRFADAFKLESAASVPAFPAFSTEPVFTPLSDERVSVPSSSVTTTSSQKGILDYLKDIGSNIFGTLKTQATATVQGAIEGATASTAGAAAGAQVGARATGISTTMLLGVVVVLILLLRRR